MLKNKIPFQTSLPKILADKVRDKMREERVMESECLRDIVDLFFDFIDRNNIEFKNIILPINKELRDIYIRKYGNDKIGYGVKFVHKNKTYNGRLYPYTDEGLRLAVIELKNKRKELQ